MCLFALSFGFVHLLFGVCLTGERVLCHFLGFGFEYIGWSNLWSVQLFKLWVVRNLPLLRVDVNEG